MGRASLLVAEPTALLMLPQIGSLVGFSTQRSATSGTGPQPRSGNQTDGSGEFRSAKTCRRSGPRRVSTGLHRSCRNENLERERCARGGPHSKQFGSSLVAGSFCSVLAWLGNC